MTDAHLESAATTPTIQQELAGIAALIDGIWQLASTSEDENSNTEAYQQAVAEWRGYREKLLQQLGQSEELARLKQLFNLSQWQLALVLLAALPALNSHYRGLYQQLNPRSRPEASLDWLLDLLAESPAQSQLWQQQLGADASLLYYRLLQPPADVGYFLSGNLDVAPDLLAYLQQQPLIADPDALCLNPVTLPSYKLLPPDNDIQSRCIQLQGESGSGRTSLALWQASRDGRQLYNLNNERLWQYSAPITMLRDILQFLTLADAELLWPDGLKALQQQPAAASLLNRWLQQHTATRIWFTATSEESLPDLWPTTLAHYHPVTVQLDIPDYKRAVSLWTTLAEALPLKLRRVSWRTIARRYRLLPGDIHQVLLELVHSRYAITTDRVLQQCVARTPLSLSGLATRVPPDNSSIPLILSPDASAQLHELGERYRLRQLLQERGLCSSTGIMALFSGSPGTGKTMAAETLASTLGMPLYKVNLANIASKWIGETEKHLDTLFAEVEHHNGMLFFDEADALFARRSEVKSSHDKNANMGVSYLLQRIESYNGLLILATNFKTNLDKAFLRRLQFSIEFARPDEAARTTLWQQWLERLPPIAGIDAAELASKLELTGAQIRNICQHTLLLSLSEADDEEQPTVTRQHLAGAIRREYQKHDSTFLAAQKLAGWLE
ncbi:ATP-binding protein [Endozoicomonadaceae bacterium StTr2]